MNHSCCQLSLVKKLKLLWINLRTHSIQRTLGSKFNLKIGHLKSWSKSILLYRTKSNKHGDWLFWIASNNNRKKLEDVRFISVSCFSLCQIPENYPDEYLKPGTKWDFGEKCCRENKLGKKGKKKNWVPLPFFNFYDEVGSSQHMKILDSFLFHVFNFVLWWKPRNPPCQTKVLFLVLNIKI